MRTTIFLPAVFAAGTTLAQAQVDTESYTDTSRLEGDVLRAHNGWRAEHDSVPLVWNNSLADFARGHTRECVFEHSGAPYGENLAAGYANSTAAVDAWGNEREMYDFSRAQFSEETGHFTQVVWNATRSVGCAATECEGILVAGQDSWYITCEYWPQGNVQGAFAQNVREQVGNVEPEGEDDNSGEESDAGRRWGVDWRVGLVGMGMGMYSVSTLFRYF
ncbi:PR-1-like protein [Tuber magnatum]|uniref:PR-1-like protein n=1 Tax=Tuber magnatum TaxID=42249 RepID=A0A317SHG0_9PEZI|nr:PR-1-like protein [Tuber magnatum]